MNYKEVAQKLGVSTPTIQDWLKGRKGIPVKRLEQLSGIFNLPKAYFQEELTFIEKGEIRITYLKSISKETENLVTEEDGEQVIYYDASCYGDEIAFLESLLETKKKQQRLKKEINNLIEQEALMTHGTKVTEFPVHTDSSSTETIYKSLEILKNEQEADYFKVIVYLMNTNKEFGGKPEVAVASEYKQFAREFTKLLNKYKLEQQ